MQPVSLRSVDPRLFQITALGGLLIYGLLVLHFGISIAQVAVLLGATLATQWAGTKLAGLPRFDPRSALISGLSLCLLLRTNSLWLAALTAFIAIAGKFCFRLRGKHLFNPTNFGLMVMMLLTGGAAWVSPGQWGSVAFFGFLMACLGGVVVRRAERSDVTFAFLAFYLGLIFGRSLYLGEPMAIPLHRLQNGAILLFAFFMISDPKTTPNSRLGRLLFAALVAYVGWYIQFRLFHTNGLLWSLVLCSFLVPVIDWLLPGRRYQWPLLTPLNPSPSPL